jgi:glutamate/tyrosine decarboxylase-like PLP-dependent enzyme
MDERLSSDLLQLDYLLERVKEQGLDYLKQISDRQTSTGVNIPPQEDLPVQGLGTLAALKYFKEKFEPIIVASGGPRYWGYVTGGTTPAAIAGDWLSSVYDQNTQAVKGQGDVSAIIELETIRLFLKLLNLPQDFLGGFVTGATMSNFTCLGVARQWIGKVSGKDFAREGISGSIRVLAGVPHSSVIKSLAMLGIGSNAVELVKLMEGNREAMDINALEQQIESLNGEPFILITSAGTVNTVDFDDFFSISQLKNKYHFWWHVDAAFGAFATCSPQYEHLLKGWENADSITVDGHKWLNVPYESAVFLIKEKHRILQVETYQNSNAPYLGDPLDHFNYLNFLPENSRRLKALPAWFSLMAYGKQGYCGIVENSVRLARQLGKYLEQSAYFELLAPVRLNNVCYTLHNEGNQDRVQSFLTRLNDTGKVFMTPTVYRGRKGIRAAFVNWRTTEADVELVIGLMEDIIKQ